MTIEQILKELPNNIITGQCENIKVYQLVIMFWDWEVLYLEQETWDVLYRVDVKFENMTKALNEMLKKYKEWKYK